LAEIRWILLGLGIVLIGGIWWWGARRGREAMPSSGAVEVPGPTPIHDMPGDATEDKDWGVPPFEPLSIKTADFEAVPALDVPILAHGQTVETSIDYDDVSLDDDAPLSSEMTATEVVGVFPERAPASAPSAPPSAVVAPAMAPPTERTSKPSETQRIVTIRVCAAGEARWSGRELLGALESHGLAFGRYEVFHRKHVDGRTLYCIASLVEPGTFNIKLMPEQDFRGVSLFAVLPGPMPPLQTWDDLVATARGLADRLAGMLQDATGVPLSPQRAEALRQEVALFGATLS
jgi:cell division protein ZipA